MTNKQEKFFDHLREYIGNSYKIAKWLHSDETCPEEIWTSLSDMRRKRVEAQGKLIERLYKSYKDPVEIEWGRRIVDEGKDMGDLLSDTVILREIAGELHESEETETFLSLVAEALSEMKKTLDYVENLEGNLMKAEARMKKIEMFFERGDTLYRERLAHIMMGNEVDLGSAQEIKILENGRQILYLSVEMMAFLQKLWIKE